MLKLYYKIDTIVVITVRQKYKIMNTIMLKGKIKFFNWKTNCALIVLKNIPQENCFLYYAI